MKHDLLFNDIKNDIKNEFSNNGWTTVYSEMSFTDNMGIAGILCALIGNELIEQALSHDTKDFHSIEGRPSIVFDHGNRDNYRYVKYDQDGIEYLVYSRCDFGNKQDYIEISEEFRLYYNLFEDYKSLNEKYYLRINSNGDEEIVAKIINKEVKIKTNYIKNFITIKKMCLVIYFDIMRYSEKELKEWNDNVIEQKIKESNFYYSQYLRDVSKERHDSNITLGWIMGKVIIKGIDEFIPKLFGNDMEEDDDKYADFYIGFDSNGNVYSFPCSEDNLSDDFGKNPGNPNFLTPIYFKREVLNKYYDYPNKYTVEDGMIYCKGIWSLRVDNNCTDYVVVFLGYLGHLPYKEQIYWKSYNIHPQDGISLTCLIRAFAGHPAEPSSPDLVFKRRIIQFNEKWEQKYGWYLFKPLIDTDKHYFESFHILANDNNPKEFDDQILSIVKIIIDSLNEKELARFIPNLEKEDKGITKFEKFLAENNITISHEIVFLRKLQNLRSTSVAHRRSESNPEMVNTLAYFNIDTISLKEVLNRIIMRLVDILNHIEDRFL